MFPFGETARRLGVRFREHLRDVEMNDKDASKPVARHFSLLNHSKQHMAIYGLSLHQDTTESRKNLQKVGTLNPHEISDEATAKQRSASASRKQQARPNVTSTVQMSIDNPLPVISISSSADRVQSVEAITEPKVDSLPGNNSNSVLEKALRHPIANDGTILNSPSVNRTNSGKVITDKDVTTDSEAELDFFVKDILKSQVQLLKKLPSPPKSAKNGTPRVTPTGPPPHLNSLNGNPAKEKPERHERPKRNETPTLKRSHSAEIARSRIFQNASSGSEQLTKSQSYTEGIKMGTSEHVKDNFDKKDPHSKDHYPETPAYSKSDPMMSDDVKKVHVKFSSFNHADNAKCPQTSDDAIANRQGFHNQRLLDQTRFSDSPESGKISNEVLAYEQSKTENDPKESLFQAESFPPSTSAHSKPEPLVRQSEETEETESNSEKEHMDKGARIFKTHRDDAEQVDKFDSESSVSGAEGTSLEQNIVEVDSSSRVSPGNFHASQAEEIKVESLSTLNEIKANRETSLGTKKSPASKAVTKGSTKSLRCRSATRKKDDDRCVSNSNPDVAVTERSFGHQVATSKRRSNSAGKLDKPEKALSNERTPTRGSLIEKKLQSNGSNTSLRNQTPSPQNKSRGHSLVQDNSKSSLAAKASKKSLIEMKSSSRPLSAQSTSEEKTERSVSRLRESKLFQNSGQPTGYGPLKSNSRGSVDDDERFPAIKSSSRASSARSTSDHKPKRSVNRLRETTQFQNSGQPPGHGQIQDISRASVSAKSSKESLFEMKSSSRASSARSTSDEMPKRSVSRLGETKQFQNCGQSPAHVPMQNLSRDSLAAKGSDERLLEMKASSGVSSVQPSSDEMLQRSVSSSEETKQLRNSGQPPGHGPPQNHARASVSVKGYNESFPEISSRAVSSARPTSDIKLKRPVSGSGETKEFQNSGQTTERGQINTKFTASLPVKGPSENLVEIKPSSRASTPKRSASSSGESKEGKNGFERNAEEELFENLSRKYSNSIFPQPVCKERKRPGSATSSRRRSIGSAENLSGICSTTYLEEKLGERVKSSPRSDKRPSSARSQASKHFEILNSTQTLKCASPSYPELRPKCGRRQRAPPNMVDIPRSETAEPKMSSASSPSPRKGVNNLA
ncbi:serine-rich adhesin for platelets-like [Montipora capricornis]|uniref:serine-rich adhesin for platelets-like n=1 Tax=Montipora capricornis TaxID=246305 RepID=UPI0035F1BA0B